MHEINLNNIQLQDFELFLAVAEYGSFTKAGEKLYVTQSWVSKRMNFLEEELGLQLFLRTRNKMTLTPAGEYLKNRLNESRAFLMESLVEANKIQTGISGSIRIGILEWANNILLNPLKQFIRNNPQIAVDVYCQQFSALREALKKGAIDIIFTLEYDNVSFLKTAISSTRLRKSKIMVYMSKEHPLADRDQLRISDLQSSEILMLHEHSSSGYNEFVRQIFHQEKIRPLISQYAANGREHLANLIFNRGVLIASEHFLDDEYLEQIRSIPLEGASTYITAVWDKDNSNQVIPVLLTALTNLAAN